MAKSLAEWVKKDVRPIKKRPIRWLSERYFFRDPTRPMHCDPEIFFAPADGVILYQIAVQPEEPILDIKGRRYTLRHALQTADFDRPCLVIGIFMTLYDVHVNRVPYSGRLSYRLLDPIDTCNRPMIDVEKSLLTDLGFSPDGAEYLHYNERVVNRVYAPDLGLEYYILQVADYDVDCITPFEIKQNQPVSQGDRFSMIRYGSQVDLIVPLSARYDLQLLQPTHWHVEAGIDPLIRIKKRRARYATSRGESHA